ncbi:hypothetical protein PR048_027458 [Dryococelus australis]|uniref:Uncharacterized protein n=1 Tax=Dryococelus australis TaxID=614101 RepID=A0ABQ9GGI8_9NEOP|nr:hypothetical protein PR048_027458 [Dryococelus australis]
MLRNMFSLWMSVHFFFLNLFPDKTLFEGEKYVGGKLSKETAAIFRVENMVGSEMLPTLAVRSLPRQCKSNQNDWMTCKIFLQYLHFLDTEMCVQNRKNCPFLGSLFCTSNRNKCTQEHQACVCKILLRDLEAKKPLKKISLLTAMHMTAVQSVITNCFRKAGFTHASVSSTTGDEVEILVQSDEWGTLQEV